MLKVGKANLLKAALFQRQQNWMQALRYGELAATKLKQLKDRRLETVELISDALACKFDALGRLGRYREAMKFAEERYTLWAMNHMRNPGSMTAALGLIEICIHNEEFEDAEHYARHAYFMIAEMNDNFIPIDVRPWFLAQGSYYLSRTIVRLARAGGIPPNEKQKAGKEAITLARKALELHTQLDDGTESGDVAASMAALAEALNYFSNVDDDEILRLIEQAIAIFGRLEGSSSLNVAVQESLLGIVYCDRGNRAGVANDLDRALVNFELALPRYREAARIFRVINHTVMVERNLHNIAQTEEGIRQIRILLATATTAAAAAAAATIG